MEDKEICREVAQAVSQLNDVVKKAASHGFEVELRTVHVPTLEHSATLTIYSPRVTKVLM